jgi:hypothetical protein
MNFVAFNKILLGILPIINLAIRVLIIGQVLWAIVWDFQQCVARHISDQELGLEKATACHINRGGLLSTWS